MRTSRLAWLLMAGLLPSVAAAFEDEFDAVPADEVGPVWRTSLLLRADHVSGLPAGREDLQRVRGRLELGLFSRNEDGFRYGLAGMLMAGSDSNRDNLRNNDNEKSDGAALTEAWIGYRTAHIELRAGKAQGAAQLTPLLWDPDLRPIGVSARASIPAGDFNRWEFVAQVADPDHPLASNGPRMTAVQAAWHWREGGESSATLRLGVIDFSNIDALRRAGLARGNTLAGGRYGRDYRLLDLQAEMRWRVRAQPLVANLDLVRNLDAPTLRDGARFSLVLGDATQARTWEAGFAIQRFQRDAVLAAMTADDWWFHTAAHGYMPWIGYGLNRRWSLRLAGFRETRDGLHDTTTRLLLDATARW